ncbi:helix-turn-helix transcriptional regulator [Shewanella sp. 10N.286.51.B8]|uniref:helix-turn-helix transcriptional regulator n=1 Tax=Shewanella sp. 10N.286.51.B8 TaxID=3229708 RepID=UPI00354BC103
MVETDEGLFSSFKITPKWIICFEQLGKDDIQCVNKRLDLVVTNCDEGSSTFLCESLFAQQKKHNGKDVVIWRDNDSFYSKVVISMSPFSQTNASVVFIVNNEIELREIECNIRSIKVSVLNIYKKYETTIVSEVAKNYGISKKLHSIINAMSMGMTRKEVSDMLSLSERGVDYHLDTGKSLLHATNIPQLIFKANQIGVIGQHDKL